MIGFSDLKSVATGVILTLAITAAAGIAGFSAWKARGALANQEIADLNDTWGEKLKLQEALTDQYAKKASTQFGELKEALGKIEIKHVTVNRTITVEREADPEFYNQQLPEGGRDAWLDARSLMQ